MPAGLPLGRGGCRAIVGIVATGNGYLLATGDGVRFSFTASVRGAASLRPVETPIVSIDWDAVRRENRVSQGRRSTCLHPLQISSLPTGTV